MKNKRIKILAHTIFLFSVIAVTILGMELFLFQLAHYNVYRVLDISLNDFFAILFFLAIQYSLLKRFPVHFSAFWKILKSFKFRWGISLAIGLLFIGLYSILPTQFPFWILFPLIVVFVGGFQLSTQLTKNPLHKVVLLLLFGAGLNASLIFWIHEDTNAGRHIQYAKQLAEKRDTIAENELIKLANLAKEDPAKLDDRDFWEKQWLGNSYLAANYRFDIRQDSLSPLTEYYQPALIFDESATPIYQLHFPDSSIFSFKLKDDFKRSVYTSNQPYKNLSGLSNYQFAVVDHDEIVLANTHDFDLNILDVQLPPVGQGEKIEWNGFDVMVYRHKEDVYVLIGEPLSEVGVWISNFALFFSLYMLVALLLEVLAMFINKKNLRVFWQKLPIQFRIQTTLITLTLVLFFVIAFTTFYFLQQNNQELAYERQLYVAETVQKAIVEYEDLFNLGLTDLSVNLLADLAERKQCDIDVYNGNGELMVSSIATSKNSPAPKKIAEDMVNRINRNPSVIMVESFNKNNEIYLRSVFSAVKNKKLEGFIAINTFESEIGTAQDIPIIMSKLLNVYVFLLLITWGVGLILINLLTQPLRLLARHLSIFKLGKQNDKLYWPGDDAIGQLIGEYNKMVDVVEKATKELAKNEREGAWQTMAQQIAHEINNPLTPLRLNVQFLTRMFDDPKSIDPEIMKRITNSLVEQIDNLSRVASRFKLLANLEVPETQPIDLKTFLPQFFNEYEKKERFDYEFISTIENGTKPIIQIDAQHFQQILRNIISNAENAIPEDKKGIIKLRLKEDNDRAIIEIEDNGRGIDAAIIDHVFDPKFSTNSSSTGLGLPICRKIVNYYKGDLSFVTQADKGTCFKIDFSVS